MKAARWQAALLAACSLAAVCAAGEPFEDRWVYVSRNLTRPEHVREVAEIVRTAKIGRASCRERVLPTV